MVVEGIEYPMGFYDEDWYRCFQVTWKQSYRSQLVINRQFYQCVSAPTQPLSEIADEAFLFENTYMAPIQSQECLYTAVHVLELDGNKQSYELLLTGANGSQGGAELPAFFASRFRLQPYDSRVRKGRKALSGVLEEMVDGDNVAAAYINDFNDYCAALAAGLLVNLESYIPVLLSPGNTRHLGNIITPVQSVAWVSWSTQSSRKVGRGA